VRPEGRTGEGTLLLATPEGHADLTFEIGEVNLDGGPTLGAARAGRDLPSGADPDATTTRDLELAAAPDARTIQVPGDVLASWNTGLNMAWGVGFTGNLWLSDVFANGDLCGFSGACTTHEFQVDGTPTGNSFEAPWVDAFHADMAYDAGRGWLWQVHVGGENGIYAIDPADGSVQDILTGSPWSDISQRGLAYDPATDTFYVGGWNEGIVYHVAGPSWATPGETLDSCATADPTISGLAWNPAFSLLWVATNSESDTIYLVDPATCESLQALSHPEPGFNGGGLEIDTVGNLWMVSQISSSAFLVESGLPNFSDAPWLTVAPETGTVAVDDSTELSVTVDATGLEPGVYRAQVVVQTNDPDNGTFVVPVMLVVPAYQQGINAGGSAHETADGTAYDADRGYGSGGYGYVGVSQTRRSAKAISGTDEDPLYRSLRQGMTAYRFDVPVEGTYRVDLGFAEITGNRAGARLFNVLIEGEVVLTNFDVFAQAGANAALDRSFDVLVTDGTLDVGFVAQRGDKPMVSALLVTHRPDLGLE
ncbi:MAG TPA: malectin domain-containing carbohydrate-binding protein, partial [Candidatus Limnocylindria bacterium]